MNVRAPEIQAIGEFSPFRDTEAKQALRLRRFYMAAVTYAVCGMFAQICAWIGYLPGWLPAWWILGAAAANVGFYAAFRSGRNLRLRDPSMTGLQLIASNIGVLALVYYAGAARGAFLTLLVVPMLFGVLRLRMVQLARIGAFGVAGYAILIMVLASREPDQVRIDIEMLNLLALTLTMAFVCLVGGYISKVRAELSRSVALIHDMAQRDPLTGIFNRRHLEDTLEREIARCERHAGRGIAVCMIDLDHFKRVNDTYGHPVGDQVLIAVGKRVGESIRTSDYLARYGGEEFSMLLEGGSLDAATAVCERIREKVAQLRIPALDGGSLSASIGLSVYEPGDDAGSLLERADRALYQAKADGRNCVRSISLQNVGEDLLAPGGAPSGRPGPAQRSVGRIGIG